MIKFIIPAVAIFLLVLFWDKINETIYKKFNIKINYIVATISIVILGVVFALLYFYIEINEKLENERNF